MHPTGEIKPRLKISLLDAYKDKCEEARQVCPYRPGDIVRLNNSPAHWLVTRVIAWPNEPWALDLVTVTRQGGPERGGITVLPSQRRITRYGRYENGTIIKG